MLVDVVAMADILKVHGERSAMHRAVRGVARGWSPMLFGALLALGVQACAAPADGVTGTQSGGKTTPQRFESSVGVLSLNAVGATQAITLTARDRSGNAIPGVAVTWKSSDLTVAEVTGSGSTAMVTAVGPGRAIISARSGDALLEIGVDVLRVQSITIAPQSVSVIAGGQLQLNAVVAGDAGALLDLRWTSDNPAIASVNTRGIVTGVTPGNTIVRVSAVGDPRVTTTAQVTVTSAGSITLTPTTLALGAGEQRALSAAVNLEPGLSTALTWQSQNGAVATISSTGVITGVSVGSSLITAVSVADTTVRATATVTVVPVVRDLDVSPAAVSMLMGETRQLAATVSADAGLTRAVLWRSGNPAVASVSATGLVTGITAGTAQITVIAQADTTQRVTALITVRSPPTVSISPSSVTMRLGEQRTLSAALQAEAGVNTEVRWRTTNPSIASVSASGVVTAVAYGATTVSAISLADSTRQAAATIIVAPAVSSVAITPSASTLVIGDVRRLSATVLGDVGVSTAVIWRSSNPSVASISGMGDVTTLAVGSVTITALAAGDTTKRATASVTVRAAPTVTVSPNSVALRLGEQRTLSAAVQAEAGVSTEVRWHTANATIASVSASGVVTAVAYGATTVSAISLADSTRQATATIIVSPAVNSVSITPSANTLVIGDVRRLTATVLGDVGVSTAVIWRSSNPSVASISGMGDVTSLAVGSVTITALAAGDTTKRATASVTVLTAPTVTVSPPSFVLSLAEQRTLVATVTADQGLSTAVTWRSSNAAVASVTTGGLVTATGFGTTTILAISQADTTRRASSTVTVQPLVQSVSVTPASAALFVGQTVQLSPTVSVQGSLSTGVSYRSSNEAVALVSATGLVTTLAAGGATITVLSAADTTKRATSTITVSSRPVTVSIMQRPVTAMVGGTTQLTAAVTADPGISTQVTWTSAAPSIATVSSGGTVLGVASGSALITATSVADATKRDTVTVSVGSRLATSWAATRLGGALIEDIVSLRGVDAANAFAVNLNGDVFRWNGSTWTVAARGSSYGTQFLAVHGSSSSNVMAVGTNGVTIRFDGSFWSAAASGTTNRLNSVFMESASSGFAVGDNGTALRWNGASWSASSTGSTQSLNSVWASGGTAFAVGTNGEVLRFASGSWARQTVPTGESLTGVSGMSSTSVVAVGTFGTVLSLSGGVWTTVNSNGISADLYAVSAVSPSDTRLYIASDDGLLLLNNGSLTRVTTPYTPRMFSVSVDAAGQVWAGGQRGSVQRLVNSSWETIGLAPDLIDAWTTSATNAWAVGEFGFIYRWNGTAWTRQATPTTATLNAVWGASASEAFAGGDGGTMLRFNGSSWTTMSFPSTSSVYGLWGSSASNVFAVTAAGEVVRFNGSSWSVVANSANALWGIHGSSPTAIVATGENGAALRFNGSVWSTITASTTGTLAGVWSNGAGATAVGSSATGTGGIAFSYSGTSWTSISTGSSRVLTSIWGPTASDLYATGEQGTLLRFNGSSWSTMATGTTDLLWSVTGAPDGIGGAFAVGYNSTVVAGSNGSPFSTAMARAMNVGRGIDLDPSAGARTVRGPMPSGKARKSRGKR
jgi:uncharacterized protein YjdB